MFVSFFPRPRLFILTAIIWTAVAVALWYSAGQQIGEFIGILDREDPGEQIIGVGVFVSRPFLFFYLYYVVFVAAFAAAWLTYSDNPWMRWSVLGSSLILFVTYFQVQVSVAINAWYGPFYDMIQAALAQTAEVTLQDFFAELLTFAGIAFVAVSVGVMTRFFVSHYVFRWRTAMNDYYMAHWPRLRHIEGAAQRVQEDTMRFAATVEGLGVSLIDSVMTLIAFLPVLLRLSVHVTELPFIGEVPHPLVVVALAWSIFGTVFLALIGIRLPGLEFRNQRVEAAYRKELVYGEDLPARADPITVKELFANVRRNYFRLYFNYLYFNVGRIVYIQTDIIFPYVILAPTIVSGQITLGIMNQILNALGQVRSSFQYLVSAWPTIVELLSIYKRLRAFEAAMRGEELPSMEESTDAPGEVVPAGLPAS